jgi:hypothetical protein
MTTNRAQEPPPNPVPERIRPELNLEKWSLWQPANSRSGPRARTLEREVTGPDGQRLVARLEVGFTDKGGLTTEEQKVYYALVKQREDRGRPPGVTPLALKRLAKLLRKPWGQRTRAALRRSLVKLRVTPFVWERSYVDGTTGQTLEVLDTFTILADLKIVRREVDGHVTTEAGYFRFHEAILRNLQAHHTKPILFEVVLLFTSEIAQILYTHLDLILSDKASYERRTAELFDDLGLEGKDYHKPSVRLRKLAPALRQLRGVPLTTGTITAAGLEPTRDGADYKLVVRKGKAIRKTAAVEATASRADVTPPPVPAEDRPVTQAEELVRYFHRVFHGAEEALPTARALDQAAGLIARLGPEPARHVVDFARREAPKTRHTIATFGGILQYATAARHDFERTRAARQRQQQAAAAREAERQRQAEEQAQEQAAAAAFERHWAALDPAQRAAFTAAALARAEGYGLGFLLRSYRAQADPTGPTALAHLRILLRAHFDTGYPAPGPLPTPG